MALPLGELARERLRGRVRLTGVAPHPALRATFPRRAFSIVLHPGAPGGAPCGAQHLFFRLGELFQGGFPLQGGTFIGAALGIGQLNGTFGVGILGTGLAALVGAVNDEEVL